MPLLILIPVWIASVALIFSTEGGAEALGWLLNASVLITVMVLDRRRPDWRPRWGPGTRVVVGIAFLLTGVALAIGVNLVVGGVVVAGGAGLLLPTSLFGTGGETADGGAPTDGAAGS